MLAHALEALGVGLDVLAVVQPLLDDHVHDRVEHRDVAAGLELQHVGRVALQRLAARVHHDERLAALGGLLEVGRGDRVVLGRVGADHDDHVGVHRRGERRGDRARADVLQQRRDRGGVAQPRAVVDVVGAEAGADQLLEQVGLLVRALGRAEAGERVARRRDRGSRAGPRRRRSSASSQLASRKWVNGLRGSIGSSTTLGTPALRISGLVRRSGWLT